MNFSQDTPPKSAHAPADALPRRAQNLARRLLHVERNARGPVRVLVEVIMVDGEWLLTVARPGELERLGE